MQMWCPSNGLSYKGLSCGGSVNTGAVQLCILLWHILIVRSAVGNALLQWQVPPVVVQTRRGGHKSGKNRLQNSIAASRRNRGPTKRHVRVSGV